MKAFFRQEEQVLAQAQRRLSKTGRLKVVDSVSSQERERIIELAKAGVLRREMCSRLGKGKGYYGVVKSILDEYEKR